MFNRLRSSVKINSFVASGVMLMGVALLSRPTYAQDLRVGCALVQHFGGAEVKMLLEHVRPTVGDGEANTLYTKYVGLRNDCQSNQRAFRVVHLSPAMHRLLDDYGVNFRHFAVSGR
jgi:hypothetical protein